MISAKDLKQITEINIPKETKETLKEIIIKLEIALEECANRGEFELQVSTFSSLNSKGWLKNQSLYRPIISKLKSLGYDVIQEGYNRNMTRLIIRW